MDNILLIHTVLPRAIVALSKAGELLDMMSGEDQKNHGKFLHSGINILLKNNELRPADVNAIAVTTGPGSYTGIRVGLSAAKGMAFALDIPVIPVSTLELLAATAIDRQRKEGIYIPLIPARLTEYFIGWYNSHGRSERQDATVDVNHFPLIDKDNNDCFYFGPGITETVIRRERFEYLDIHDISEGSFSQLAYDKFIAGAISPAAYVNPSYLKAAYTTRPK